MGVVIGVRSILSERRREGKAASSVFVYLQNKVLLGPEACIKMSGKRTQWSRTDRGPRRNFVGKRFFFSCVGYVHL